MFYKQNYNQVFVICAPHSSQLANDESVPPADCEP